MLFQTPLPSEYTTLEASDIHSRIAARKAQLGPALCILGHHYQSDDVIQYADFVGDSLKLSQQAASRSDARFIVFCGVHFMAESADILSQGRAAVILPHMMAGCGMADLAEDDAVALAIDELRALSPLRASAGTDGAKVVPITYVNSTAAIKALTARAGGACCTSSNVRNVCTWAFAPAEQGGAAADKILAVPDQHLGMNTAVAMGFGLDQCVLYDPKLYHGGLTETDVQRAKFILWKGQCYVHQRFTTRQVQAVREGHPGIRVMVHPECTREVVALADASGSTEQIIRTVTASPSGSAWAIGTESNLVNRLAKRLPDRFIRTLGDNAALCIQMARIDTVHLLWVLDHLAQGKIVNQVKVAPDIASDARIALERMIAINP
jgi:quinolinate synthase